MKNVVNETVNIRSPLAVAPSAVGETQESLFETKPGALAGRTPKSVDETAPQTGMITFYKVFLQISWQNKWNQDSKTGSRHTSVYSSWRRRTSHDLYL